MEVVCGVLCPHRNGDPGAGSETTHGEGDASPAGGGATGVNLGRTCFRIIDFRNEW